MVAGVTGQRLAGGILWVILIGVGPGQAEESAACYQVHVGESAQAQCVAPGDSFRDGENLPEVVVLPKGNIAAGKYEVTYDQYVAFVKATNRPSPKDCNSPFGKWNKSVDNPGFEQKPTSPAVCVNWADAIAYAGWLSSTTHAAYRLPSLAEAQSYQDVIDRDEVLGVSDVCKFANLRDLTFSRRFVGGAVVNCMDRYVFTAPGDQKPGNHFGLHNVIGNADEMVDDCGGKSGPNCEFQATIGGSWISLPNETGPQRHHTALRSNTIGFRVVRELARRH